MRMGRWGRVAAGSLCPLMLYGTAFLIPASAQMSRGRGGARPMRSGAQSTAQEPAVSFTGEVRSVNGNKLVMSLEEGNTMELRFNKHTRFLEGDRAIKPAALAAGDRVQVEVHHAIDGSLDLLSLQKQPAAKKTQGELR